jgi:hypothetical protein
MSEKQLLTRVYPLVPKCPTKEELLTHYSRRDPTKFVQVDAWVNPRAGNVIRLDKDGDWICWQDSTFELMLGASFIPSGGVRVLIPPHTQPKDAVRVLGKIERMIKRGRISLAEDAKL